MRVFRGHLSICMCASLTFGFEGRMSDLIELVPGYCISVYFAKICVYLARIPLTSVCGWLFTKYVASS